jgi:hypothetical protein
MDKGEHTVRASFIQASFPSLSVKFSHRLLWPINTGCVFQKFHLVKCLLPLPLPLPIRHCAPSDSSHNHVVLRLSMHLVSGWIMASFNDRLDGPHYSYRFATCIERT